MKRAILGILLLVMIGVVSQTPEQKYQAAVELSQGVLHPLSVPLFWSAARNNHAQAQLVMARYNRHGSLWRHRQYLHSTRSVWILDEQQADYWTRQAVSSLKRATEQDDARAQFMLFAIYTGANADLFEVPEGQALRLLKRAASQGHAQALVHLASYYEEQGAIHLARPYWNEAVASGNEHVSTSFANHAMKRGDAVAYLNYRMMAAWNNYRAMSTLTQDLLTLKNHAKLGDEQASEWWSAVEKTALWDQIVGRQTQLAG